MYKLFIDDLRNPPDRSYVVVRSYDAAIEYMLEFGCPLYISFDHDLGENIGKTGYDIAKWIIERDLNSNGSFLRSDFSFNVHSANPVGKKNIEKLFQSYLDFKEKENSNNEVEI